MALKVRTSKRQTWLTYERDGESARFLVSPLTPDEFMKLMEKRRGYEWERNQRFEKMDLFGAKLDKIVAVILDWEGVTDESGKALPCDREQKLALYQHESEMIDWVLAQVDALGGQRIEERETERKNSSAGRKP